MIDREAIMQLILNAVISNTVGSGLNSIKQFCKEEYPKLVAEIEARRKLRIEIEQIIENPKLLEELSDSKSPIEILPDSEFLKAFEQIEDKLSPHDCFNICEFYRKQGLYQEAKLLYEHFQYKIESLSKENLDHLMVWLGNLGKIYSNLAEYEKAVFLHQKSLELAEKTPEEKMYKRTKRKTLANCHNNLGEVFYKKGDYKQAEQEFKVAIKKAKRDESLFYLINSVKVYFPQQDYNTAKEKLSEISELVKDIDLKSEKCSEQQKIFIALYCQSAAQLYDDMEKYPEAEEFYKKAIDIRRNISRDKDKDKDKDFEKDPNYANYLHSLGLHYSKREMYDLSIKYLNQSLDLRNRLFDYTHRDILHSIGGIGTMYSRQGSKDNARKYLEVAMKLSEKSLGKNHPQPVAYRKQLKNI